MGCGREVSQASSNMLGGRPREVVGRGIFVRTDYTGQEEASWEDVVEQSDWKDRRWR